VSAETAEFKNTVCIGETKAALKLRFETGEVVWCPKTVVHDDSEVWDSRDNSRGTFVVGEWFAIKEGWV
jgi:hypothetical protein